MPIESMPLVSVVTATYLSNPEHLHAALTSATSQTYGNLELIVSDDSPDDRLQGFVHEFRDERISYRRNTPALGVAQNHWRCLREARGEYAVILNHDDTLELQFVERLLAPMLVDPDLVLSFCDHWIIDVDGVRKPEETEQTTLRYGRRTLAPGLHRPFFQLLLRQSVPMAMGALFRRSHLPHGLPAEAGPAYDLWLTYLLSRDGAGAWFIPERLSSWRSHASNLTAAGDLALLDGAARCWSTVAEDASLGVVRQAAKRRAASALYSCARWCARQGRGRASREFAARSFKAHPSWRSIALYVLGGLPWPSRARPARSGA